MLYFYQVYTFDPLHAYKTVIHDITYMQKIAPCLWFDDKAEQAAKFYTSIFKNSKVSDITLYGNEGYEIHGRKAGSVATVEFEIEGQEFVLLTAVHYSNLTKSFRSKCIARRKRKWTIIGINFPRAATKKAKQWVGSRTYRSLMANRSHSFGQDATRKGY